MRAGRKCSTEAVVNVAPPGGPGAEPGFDDALH